MLFLAILQFISFPSRNDAILSKENAANIVIEGSGSIGIYRDSKCQLTTPNHTLVADKKIDKNYFSYTS